MTGLTLRPMTETDIPAVRALHDAAFAASVSDQPVRDAHAALVAAPDYVADLRRSDVWLAERRGTPLGTAGWVPQDGAARIRKVFVHPAAWRQGLATRLVRAAEARAVAAGQGRFVLRANLFAVPLYQRLGYVAVEDGVMELPGGLTTPVLFMRRDADQDRTAADAPATARGGPA
ncbi:GNAT family N-acetyltransferase [Roseomonas sp. CCTCC AB2023176]|uniref:GNAT family N-acetyltransferase n=1 Tax=Roseomonas sp. CCTCC AB2023176 TaxID=3342640 RepID=UPI0035D56E3D